MSHHVLHLIATAQPEGKAFAWMVGALARGLDPERYSIEAWFLGGDGPLAAELRDAGIQVRVLNWMRGARDPFGAWRFWRALRGQEFAIVHMHLGGRSVRWLARGITRAKIIAHLHGRVLESRGPTPVLFPVQGFDLVIATSRAVAERALGAQPVVVYPGVAVPEQRGEVSADLQAPPPRIVGTAGRLVPIKGIGYLIRALAVLRTEFSDLRLEIAGSGPERPAIENEVKSLGLADCVTFLGWQDDLLPVLTRWDVFALPSLEEGFGIAALEAMAAGLPVVATAVGGVPELVQDGVTGWLVPPRDSAALADRLRALLLDPRQRRIMGVAGRVRARENFSVDRMVAAIAKIYDSLLEPSGKG